tara:strand:- start:1151 stop:2401 length:1251 start_codon:yes stop_codon:yes gene_type:complete
MSSTLNLGNGNWAVKEDSLLGYNNENGNYKPLPFDFTRASSATVVNKVGLIETVQSGIPRIDFSDDVNGALLAEPQRTNLLPYSEDFTEWSSKINIDVTLNSATSPDGVVNATFINENNSNAQHFVGQSLSITNGQDISISVYAKKNQRDVLQISPSGNYLSTSGYANYDLSNGLVTASGGGVTAEIEGLTNGWFRCVAKFTANNTASGTAAFFLQNSTTASRGSSYDGDGTSGIYVWGAQLEEATYPTSYIPTSGSTVTRVAETCSQTGIGSLINDSEGVLFAEIAALDNDGTNRIISLSDGTTTNRVSLIISTTTNTIRAMAVSGSTTFDEDHAVTSVLDYNKIAIKYKVNDFALWINGVEVDTDNSGDTPTGLDRIVFDVGNGSLFPFYGKVNQLQVYPTALSDAELTILTTL